MEIVIAGATGGIGLAIVQEVIARFPHASVHATYHKQPPNWQHPRLVWHHTDVAQDER